MALPVESPMNVPPKPSRLGFDLRRVRGKLVVNELPAVVENDA
jgi:hypothetical protein